MTKRLRQTLPFRIFTALQSLEIDQQFLRTLITPIRLFVETLLDHPVQFRRHFGIVASNSFRLRLPDQLDGQQVCGSVERQPSGRHLIKHDAQRKNVSSVVEWRAYSLFGAHIGNCAHRDACLCCRLARDVDRVGFAVGSRSSPSQSRVPWLGRAT